MNACPYTAHRTPDDQDAAGRLVGVDRASDISGFAEYIAAAVFPCVGAKSALNKGRMRFARLGALGSEAAGSELCSALSAFSHEFPDAHGVPTSFVALFDPIENLGEEEFETKLWEQLQRAHELDRQSFGWDAAVSRDAASNDFSFSIGGRGFFVVGLHPNASRLSRRAPQPCLVFNFHDLFVTLKASGKYQTMQTAIRERDLRLQGSVNPVLARFGQSSEARQYSGRAVENDWQCPFHAIAA